MARAKTPQTSTSPAAPTQQPGALPADTVLNPNAVALDAATAAPAAPEPQTTYNAQRYGDKSEEPQVEPTPRVADEDVLKIVDACLKEAQEARIDRIVLNKRNWNMYYGRQDWSHKEEGQSTEVLPKVAEAVEQLCAFVKKALTQFGDWFSVEVPDGGPLTDIQARDLLVHYLSRVMTGPNKFADFSTVISNATKSGLLESFLILKVHGQRVPEPIFSVDPSDPQKLIRKVRMVWRPRIDIVPTEDYYPDPTGRGLYDIHRVERDLVDVIQSAEDGIYDKAVVAKIRDDFSRDGDRDRRRASQRNQREAKSPPFRKRVVIDEFYGTLIDTDGKLLYRDCVCAVANNKYVIRKPMPNPYWHGRCSLVAVPLIQVPHTVWGRALFDHASSLNMAMNELFNLMLDGGIAEVWGVRQVRTDWLADPRQIAGGIPQVATLAINADVPLTGKVVENCTTGAVPQEAMQMFNLADREFQAAALVNDIRLGNLPPRQVKATEIVETSTNSAAMVDSLASDLERELIDVVLEMTFLNLMQNADDLGADEIVDKIGAEAAFNLANMEPAKRFSMYGRFTKFAATGISGTLNKARDFQKLMAMMQSIGSNPVMMQAFMSKFSPEKTLTFIFKSLNLDPDSIENSPAEQAQVDARMQQVAALSRVTGGAGQQASPQPGEAAPQSEIAQNANPTGGPA